MVANTDYSPTNDIFSYPEAFDKAYLADAYTSRPDHTFDNLFDTNTFFDQPLSSVETASTLASKNQPLFNTSPTTDFASWSNANSAPFGRIGNVNEAFPTSQTLNNTSSDPFDNPDASPRDSSPTPSLCGDGPRPQHQSSPSLSPRPLKRETPDEAANLDDDTTPKRPQKKRGRPRIDRSSTDSSASSKTRATQRLPHNQVERKYREGLNSELERLRRAVPTLIQRDPRDLTSPPKPSKATILASAIDYIKKIEQERDILRDENEKLRGMRPMVRNR